MGFFFQAEDGIRDDLVTGVQTCALPIYPRAQKCSPVKFRLCGKERNFTGEHFWARGYAVSTVGFELEQVRKYIRSEERRVGKECRHRRAPERREEYAVRVRARTGPRRQR